MTFISALEFIREVQRDLWYATRAYGRRGLATGLAVSALALGFGVTIGIFSVLNAALIRTLPFRDPEQLVQLLHGPISIAQGRAAFQAWQAESPYLASAASFTANDMNVGLEHDSARVRVAETTSNVFQFLGVHPVAGRPFTSDEDVPGRSSVAVVGFGFAQQFFGGASNGIGSTIRVNGVQLTIIGVAPPRFDYPEKTSIWIPTIYDLDRVPKTTTFSWDTIGRLKPGVTIAQASQLFEAEAARAAGHRPRLKGYSSNPELRSLREVLAAPVRSLSLTLMAMVTVVLVIACGSVAHLVFSFDDGAARRTRDTSGIGCHRGPAVKAVHNRRACVIDYSSDEWCGRGHLDYASCKYGRTTSTRSARLLSL